MKKYLWFVWTVLLVMLSCSTEDYVERSQLPQGKIEVTFEQSSSRLAIGQGNVLTWSAKDSLVMFNEQGEYSYWELTSEPGLQVGVFEGNILEGTLRGAAFPAVNALSILDDTLTMILPSELSYEAGTCNLPMWASFSSIEENISFKHLGALLKVNFSDIPQGFTSLIVTTDKAVSGTFMADLSVAEPTLQVKENGLNSVKVIFPAINDDDDNDRLFFIPLPVGVYGTINVSVSDGNDTISIADWSNRTIKRKKVYLASLSYRMSDASTPKEISNELNDMMAATSNATIEITNQVTATEDAIEIPAEASKVDLNFTEVPVTTSSTPLKITEESATEGAELKINIPVSDDDTYMEIDMPTTTVNVQSGTYKKIVARTASNTLILDENVEVADLVILAGNVELNGGKITGSLIRAEENVDEITSVYVEDKKELEGVTIGAGIKVVDNIQADYVTFAAEAEQTFRMTKSVETLEYSVNNGRWTELGTDTITFGGEKGNLRLRGKSAIGTAVSIFDNSQIILGNKEIPVSCTGNILTLVDYENYENETLDTSNARFCYLFAGCGKSLTSAPKLPAMVLAEDCYSFMFARCSNLAVAPELPATTLANYCYYGMFMDCKSLVASPVLPATTLVEYCYFSMFSNCSNLNSVTMLAVDVSADFCLYDWLKRVSGNGTFIKNEAVTDIFSFGIPTGWEIKSYESTDDDSDNDSGVTPNSNLIKYTSTDGNIVVPNDETAFGNSKILSNTYKDGVGIIEFDSPVLSIRNAFKGCTTLKSIVIPEQVQSITQTFENCTSLANVVLPKDLQIINYYSFKNCTALTDIILNENLKEVNLCAFENCISITSIDIPDNVIKLYGAFKGCTSLANVNLNDKLTEITGFERCTSLTTIVIPDNITKIGGTTFEGCSALTNITLGKNLKEIDNSAFEGCKSLTQIEIPNSVTKIGSSVFCDCTSLVTVNLSDSLQELNDNAFRNCQSLTKLEIPQSTKIIGNDIVWNCRSLESIVFPDKVDAIGKLELGNSKITRIVLPIGTNMIADRAFVNCELLEEVVIPETVTCIGEAAFQNCKLLSEIELPTSIKKLGNCTFEGCLSLANVELKDSLEELGENVFKNCMSLTNLEIPQSIKIIGRNIVHDCKNLESIIFPNKVDSIGEQRFNDSKVTHVTLPVGTTKVANDAFYNCKLLTNVTIPSGVTSIGDNAFNQCLAMTNIILPQSVTYIGEGAFQGSAIQEFSVPSGVTSINNGTFGDCKSLKSIQLGNAITYIGEGAFLGSAIQEFTVPSGVTSINNWAFSECKSLKSIQLGNAITYIGERCFYNCTSLASVKLGPNVTNIGDYAFAECSMLADVNLGNKLDSIGSSAFYKSGIKSLIVPESVSYIGMNIVEECDNLETLMYPEKEVMEFIGRENINFRGHKKLTKIRLPKGLTSIKSEMFEGCTSLVNVIIPSTVTSIEYRAFANCSSLVTVNLPNSITKIGDNIFYDCSQLKEMIFPSSLKSMGECYFSGCTNLERVIFSSNAMSIRAEDFRFGGCKKLKYVTLPTGMEGIVFLAFEGCTALTEINIPETITYIGENAFSECSSLTEVTIPKSVKDIHKYAFSRAGIKTVKCKATTPPTLGDWVFGISKITLYVPSGCKSDYSNSKWMDWASNIIEM